jgi:hypothetical protein
MVTKVVCSVSFVAKKVTLNVIVTHFSAVSKTLVVQVVLVVIIVKASSLTLLSSSSHNSSQICHSSFSSGSSNLS